jgi:hypothetical protein
VQTPPQILAALLELHHLEDKLNAPKARPDAPLLARNEGVRKKIPAAILSHHDRMRQRGKRSVAPIRHGVCCGCFIAVPIGERSHIESGKDLQLCQTCGRFLYLEAAEAASLGDPPPVALAGIRRACLKQPRSTRRLPKVLTLEQGRRRSS